MRQTRSKGEEPIQQGTQCSSVPTGAPLIAAIVADHGHWIRGCQKRTVILLGKLTRPFGAMPSVQCVCLLDGNEVRANTPRVDLAMPARGGSRGRDRQGYGDDGLGGLVWTTPVHAFQRGWELRVPRWVKVSGQKNQAPTMVIPADVNVEIHLDSLDVRHGFYVSQFNFSRHASPGYKTDFNFSSTRERTEASAPNFVGSTTRSSPSS